MSQGRALLWEPKTKKSRRTIRLSASAVRASREHLKRQIDEIGHRGDLYRDEGLVFTSESGTLINRSNLRRRSSELLLKRSGVPGIRFYDLRHTCATLLFARNVHPKHVQESLGHATVAMTLDT